MTNPVSLSSLYRMLDIRLILDFLKRLFFANTISPTDLLSPSPVPRSRTFHLFLSTFRTVQISVPSLHVT